MHGKILIVEPIATNRIVLKVKLSAAYYDVSQASTIQEAVEIAMQSCPDVIISAALLPDGSAGDLTKALRDQAGIGDVPIIALDNNGNQPNRHALLEAGVDDVLTTPVDDTLLLARIRSLVRAFSSSSEWQLRDDTSCALGLNNTSLDAVDAAGSAVLVSDDAAKVHGWLTKLRHFLPSQLSMVTTKKALSPYGQLAAGQSPDVFVLVIEDGDPNDMMRLLACIRAHSDTRHCGVLILLTTPDPVIAAQALDLGANDLMFDGFDAQELALRVRTLVQRKKIGEQLRATVRTGLEAAICDPLTGLHNRRYAMPHLDRIAQSSIETGKPYAVMVADMDHFKQINDIYGHAAGDAVLIETARRLRENLRTIDMVARIGGEEFLIVLPGVTLASARTAAYRLRQMIGETPFKLPNKNTALKATVSIGLAIGGPEAFDTTCNIMTPRTLLENADQALYRAKTNGRNQVTLSQPAA
ncbi:MAG: two-component system cell cycle response regulator [Ascidiaceihabitans sp.]|jgi:two-component system cell cycle response regulator